MRDLVERGNRPRRGMLARGEAKACRPARGAGCRIAAGVMVALFMLLFVTAACGETLQAPDYAQAENWAYLEVDKTADADVFFICPTVYGGDEDCFNMPMDDEDAKNDFLGATNMEKGIYDSDARFFAPYYRQAGLNVYELPAEDREEYLSLAYADIKEAFLYYLGVVPLVIAEDQRVVLTHGYGLHRGRPYVNSDFQHAIEFNGYRKLIQAEGIGGLHGASMAICFTLSSQSINRYIIMILILNWIETSQSVLFLTV